MFPRRHVHSSECCHFVYKIQIKFKYRQFASIFVKVVPAFWNLEYLKCTVFCTFLLHALTYWAEILHMTLFYCTVCTTDQVRVASICVIFYRSYLVCPFWNLEYRKSVVCCPRSSSVNFHNFNFFSRTARWILMKLGRDEVLMVPYKCCCFSARSAQGRIQGGAKIGHKGPFLRETSSSDWKATPTNQMNSNDLEACGKKCFYFWFHSEVKFLTSFYAPGLKGPPGASSNRIVRLSVRLSVCV